MQSPARLLVTLLGLALAVAPTSVCAQEPAYAIVNVAVIPMDSNRVLHDQTVVVRGARIVALGPAATVAVPAGATRIDGRGKFLTPGLADMHAHWTDTTGSELYAYVANGVTTVRSMGFYGWAMQRNILTLRARAAKGELVSPRIYAASDPVSDPNAIRQVEEAKAAGFDLVKLYGWDTKDGALDSVAAVARRLGLPIAGHAPPALQRAIDVGYASTEHLQSYMGVREWWHYWNDTTASVQQARQTVADTAKLHALASALQRAGVWTCPTLAMYEARLLNAATWPELRYVTPERQQRWQKEQDEFNTRNIRATAQAGADARATIVRALRDAGAGLLLGTDANVHFMVHGFAVHRELQALVRAGLSPYEALATGTRNVAAYFGTLDSTGTVAVGKRADLVLLAANPLVDIRHMMQPTGVMLAGRWLDRAELDRGLAALEGKIDGDF